MPALRPNRHPNSNLTRASSHLIREEAINSRAGKDQSEGGKEAGKLGQQLFHEYMLIDLFGFGGNAEHGQIGVAARENVANGRDKLLGISERPNGESGAPYPWRVYRRRNVAAEV